MPNNIGILMIHSNQEPSSFRLSSCIATFFLAAGLAACSGKVDIDRTYPEKNSAGNGSEIGSILGSDGFSLFDKQDEQTQTPKLADGAGVNSFLWRAALDTLSFIPLQSTDVRGGVIVTDWYSTLEAPNERIKVTVYILASNLRADALTVSSFKQRLQNGNWISLPQNEAMNRRLEDVILIKARELRISEPSK